MGSHTKKKRYNSDSSSDSDSNSSEEKIDKRKSSKKYKNSDDSDSEHKSKKRYGESFNESDAEKLSHRRTKRYDDQEIDNKSKKTNHDNKYKSTESNSFRHKDERSREREKESRYRDKPERKEHEDKEKYSKDKREDRGYNRDKYKYDGRSRNDDKDKNKNNNRNRASEGNRRDQNEYRYKKNDNRRRRSSSFDHANAKWGKPENESKSDKQDPQSKEKPNFGLSGKLTEETNTYRGVVIKYSEPPEARKPRRRWRLYPFKGEKALQTLYIHRESAYLIGRERKIVDLPVDHPSCSKQHAALQYRLVPFTRENGSTGKRVRPYLIDLESANGTLINDKKMESKKYYELFEKDVIKFGYSSREYVLLHENSKDEALDDDVKMEEEDEVVVKVEKEH